MSVISYVQGLRARVVIVHAIATAIVDACEAVIDSLELSEKAAGVELADERVRVELDAKKIDFSQHKPKKGKCVRCERVEVCRAGFCMVCASKELH